LPVGDATPPAVIEPSPVPRDAKARPLTPLAPPAALSATPNLPGLLLALRRRWLLALTLGLLLSPAVAFVVWTLRPITFTARPRLHVKSSPEWILYKTPDGQGDFSNYQRAQTALVKSPLVLNSALRDPKVERLPIVLKQDDPVAWLEREIHADFGTAPEVL